MSTALSAIASEQPSFTKRTMKKWKKLDYTAAQPGAILKYLASNMVLDINSNASHLNKPNAWSRVEVHNFLLSYADISLNNGAVLNISQIIKAVMSLASESELGAHLINAKYLVPVRRTLEDIGHPQPKTTTHTDNSTSYGAVNSNIQPKVTN